MRATIIAGVLLVCSPATAQLSPDAYTWGAEISAGGRTTVISARKAGTGWSVVMECSVPQRGGRERILRYRGTAKWKSGMMLVSMDRSMRVTVVPRDDGGVGVVTSGSACAQGAGWLTSGGR